MSELVTFGETMLRLSPPRGERLETADTLDFRAAGAESNVAIAAARLGVDATWLSKLPESPLGRRVAGGIRRHDVTPNVVWDRHHRQGTYYIEQGGEPRGTDVIYDREGAAVRTVTPEELDTRSVETSDIFFTTGITPALSETLRDTTAELLTTAGTTAFDLNYRSKLWTEAQARECFDQLLPGVDLLFVPGRDARSVLGVSGDDETTAETVQSRYDVETVVLTRGDDGALARHDGRVIEQPVFGADTVDPIGTGDAFVGGFLARQLRGGSISEALEYGAALAALKRTIAGDFAVVTPDEVEAVIEEERSGIDR